LLLAVHASVPQLGRVLSRYSFDPPAPNGYAQQSTTFPAATNDSETNNSGTGNSEANGGAAGDRAGNDSAVGEGTANNGESCSGETGLGVSQVGPIATWNGLALIEGRASAPAELSMSHDQWGRFTLRFSASADVGALIEAALSEAKDALFSALDKDAPRREVTWADAMAEIAARSMGSVTSTNRGDAYRTYIHLDTEGAWLTGKPRLPAHLAAKLTCDGILQPVWHTQGAPVNVGRAQRIVPPRTRRLVEDRDRGCRYPGCAASQHIECHHLIHWADGGPTDTFNLACLCPYHHEAHPTRRVLRTPLLRRRPTTTDKNRLPRTQRRQAQPAMGHLPRTLQARVRLTPRDRPVSPAGSATTHPAMPGISRCGTAGHSRVRSRRSATWGETAGSRPRPIAR
jgi:hypothetical protein